MSKDITIKEGSLAKEFGTVKKIRVNNIGGGTSDWVPEDEVQLTSLHVSENGEFNAEDEGYYGYNPVVVSGVGGVGFTAEDGDVIGGNPLIGGNGYWHDEDGVHLMPEYIAITTPPIRTKYYDGDTINLAGAVIQAFNADGSVWTDEDYPQGGIPYNELTISPKTANKEGTTRREYSDGSGINALKILMPDNDFYQSPLGLVNGKQYSIISNPNIEFYLTLYHGSAWGANTAMNWARANLSEYRNGAWTFIGGSTGRMPRNSFGELSYGAYWNLLPESTENPSGVSVTNLHPVGGTQVITVTWHRYGDGAELSTTFEIEVENRGDGSTTHETNGE